MIPRPKSCRSLDIDGFLCIRDYKPGNESYHVLKVLIDGALASIMIALFSPIFIATGLAIRFDSPGPAIYKSERLGLGGKPFQMYKFRSMQVGADSNYLELRQSPRAKRNGPFLKDIEDSRVTRVGKFIRGWSLDELPQLINVARGEMSLVGLRPALRVEVEEMGQHGIDRLRMRPGMTGLCQINGRSTIPYETHENLERHYLKHAGPSMDFCILLNTPRAVFSKHGAF